MSSAHRLRRRARPATLVVAALFCCAAAPAVAGAQFDSPSQAQYEAPYIQPLPPPPDPPKPEPRAAPAPEPAPAPAAIPAPPPPDSGPERSSLASAIPTPGELDLSAEHVSEGGMLTLLLVALLYLPVMIFNKTTEHNHEVIKGWMAGPLGWFATLGFLLPFGTHPLALLLSTGIVSACLFSFVEPGFPTEPGALQYLLGMMLGFSFIALVFFSTWREVVHRLEPDSQGGWTLYPPYILLAAGLVLIARLAHFLPGVVLGTLAEYEPGRKLSRRTAGLRVLVTYTALLIVGAAAWFAWIPVEHAASEEGAGSLTLILDSALAVVFVTGLESVVFGLIPLKFLDGSDLFAWHKGLWLALWGVAVFWFVEVILHPALTTYSHATAAGAIWFAILFAALMIVAMGTWLYFRIREARMGPPVGEEAAS